jgi:CheY-like chemotaxis protein
MRLLALLEGIGLACVLTENGRQAIEVVRNMDQAFHLLVTDMDMPVHTGWDVIEATQQHRGADFPIIMQTGEAKYSYVQRRAAEFGVTLIDKQDIDNLFVPAVRQALGLAAPADA